MSLYLHWPKSTSLNVIHLYTVQTIAQVSMLLAHWRHKHQRRPQMNTLDWKGQVEISKHTNYFFEERSRKFYLSSFKKINWNMTHLFLWSRICSSLKFHENVSMSLHLFSVIFVKYNWFGLSLVSRLDSLFIFCLAFSPSLLDILWRWHECSLKIAGEKSKIGKQTNIASFVHIGFLVISKYLNR